MEYEWRKDPLPGVVDGGVIEIEWGAGNSVYRVDEDGWLPVPGSEHGAWWPSGEPMCGQMLRWRWLTIPAATPTRHEATAEVLRDLSDAAARLDGEGLDELYEAAVGLAVRLKMLGAGS